MDQKKTSFKTIGITVIVTFLATMILTTFISVPFLGKVIISKKDYDILMETENYFGKNMALKDYINKNFIREVKSTTMVDGSLKGMFESLNDPYSRYMNKKEMKRYIEDTSGKFVGIGITVRSNEKGLIEIITVMENSPAKEAGLKPGDIIYKVQGKEYEGKNLEKAVENIKGKEGTKTNIVVLRETEDKKIEEIKKDITRREIIVNSVESQVLENNIGYISISAFEDKTYDDFKTQLDALKNKKIESLVLDLRGNPGGSFDRAVKIADTFIDEGLIVYTKDRNGKTEKTKATKGKLGLPLVVLVNEGSASASEIVASSIQDHKVGTIVGEKSFGKGVVQIFKQLSDGTGFKLTISEYFSPNGNTINKKGVKPDVEVKNPEKIESIGPSNIKEDLQLQKGLEILKNK